MKRMVSFGLVLAFIICIILVPWLCPAPCHPPAPGGRGERTVTLAGGAADPSRSQDQAPEGEDSSADAGQAPENPGAGKHRRSDHSVPALTQQYGTCSNYTQLDDQACGSNHPPGHRHAGPRQ